MKSKIFHFLKHPNRWVLVCLILVLCVGVTFAADTTTGIGAINQVANDITKYVPAVQTLLYAIAGVVALGGAVSVYIKMNNEEQDVKNILVLKNWLKTIRKEMKQKFLCISHLQGYFAFPIFENMTLKKI